MRNKKFCFLWETALGIVAARRRRVAKRSGAMKPRIARPAVFVLAQKLRGTPKKIKF